MDSASHKLRQTVFHFGCQNNCLTHSNFDCVHFRDILKVLFPHVPRFIHDLKVKINEKQINDISWRQLDDNTEKNK